MSANPLEPTSNIEVRITRLESEVSHLGTAVGELRLDMRDMARKIDTLTPLSATNDLRGEVHDLRGDVHDLRGEMRDLRVEMRGETGDLRSEIGALRVEVRTDIRDLGRRIDHQTYYLIGSQAAILTIVLGTMAKGFRWL